MSTIGARFLADAMETWGSDHAVLTDVLLRHPLIELDGRGVRRVPADGDFGEDRVKRGHECRSERVGLRMAQDTVDAGTNADCAPEAAWLPRSRLHHKELAEV